jgi:uncharacterized protein YqfA (UPF0365 family)
MAWPYIIAAIVVLGIFFVVYHYFSLWLRATVSQSHVGFLALVSMSLRKVNPQIVVQCRIMAAQAGLPELSTDSIESQYLAGGNVYRITQALIVAARARIPLDWNTAAAIDLSGRDILEAVQVTVTPMVIDCPDMTTGHADTLSGVSKDGIQLNVRVRVTVRTNLFQLIGGATESTVIARVGQGVVSAIGACQTYQEVLADPLVIARKVMDMNLDSQTAFAIVSIDIADIDVGTNIGARLRIESANTNIRIARALAEKRRAMAIARVQEMKALTTENQAVVVLAEAGVPIAMAESFRSGNLGKNIRRKAPKPHGSETAKYALRHWRRSRIVQ